MDEQPKVFVSYSHDSVEHGNSVWAFAEKLRSEGIDCILDQYETSPPEGWPRWMDKQIRDAKFVLMVCTETYYKRVMGEEKPGSGLGIRWEGNLIYQHIYNAGSINTKFIPVLFKDGQFTHIPTPLQGATHYRIDDKPEYDRLYWRLRGVTATKPTLGKLRPLPAKERKTDPGLFLTGCIDIFLWDKAVWKGVMFITGGGQPPILAFLFQKPEPAREIFKGWLKRFGQLDAYNEMRISIIEGDIKGELPGYSVHVSVNPDNIFRRADNQGISVPKEMVMILSRLHRMNPKPGSRNLEHFKQAFAQFHTCKLMPAILESSGVRLFQDDFVIKREIQFRHVDEITSTNDPDVAVNKELCKKLKPKKSKK
jgi:hypothetical protein